jgi:hypothetical protein
MVQLDSSHLFQVHQHALTKYKDMPSRCRLVSMNRDLTDNEKRDLSFFEASVTVLVNLGILDTESLSKLDTKLVSINVNHTSIPED